MRIRLMGHYFYLPLLALAGAEFLVFVAAMSAGTGIRLGFQLFRDGSFVASLLPRVLVFAAVCLVSYFALGLYTTRQRAGFFGVGLRIIIGTGAAVSMMAVLIYLFPTLGIGRGVLGISAMLAALAATAIRLVASRSADIQGLRRRVLAFGQSEQLATFSRMRRRSDRAGYQLVGVVHPPGDNAHPIGETNYEAPHGLKALCEELQIDELVVAVRDRRQSLPVVELMQCRLAGISVIEFITFMERETGRIELDMLSPSWLIYGPGFRRDGVRLFTARGLDFLASALLVIGTSPIMLLAMLAIWLEDGRKGGGIFYRQDRVGFEGRIFPLTKFRSMRADAETNGAQWAQKNDPRVTRVGAFMRKTRIDELPQLLNVLKGHMAFVGPRPERPEFVAGLLEKIPFYACRHSVKPGITGWAQLCYPYGSSAEDARQKLQYDLYYVKHHSLLFDLTILVQTVEVVLMGKGAR